MLSGKEYIRISIEVNLFFQRIMKEHLFFIETSLPPVESNLIARANILKMSFEHLLSETVTYARGIIDEKTIKANDIVTPYTLKAEKETSRLTGATIDTGITIRELELVGIQGYDCGDRLEAIIDDLNRRSCNLVEEVIEFKKKLLALQLSCNLFVNLYPLLIEHITREAEYYQETLRCLLDRKLPKRSQCDELNFWNNIMGKHAQFIDGLLDPTEVKLKDTAEKFANKFAKLIKECSNKDRQIVIRSAEITKGIRDYKRAATEGLLQCQIRSIIVPLLGDHVLREANHFLKLLKMAEGKK